MQTKRSRARSPRARPSCRRPAPGLVLSALHAATRLSGHQDTWTVTLIGPCPSGTERRVSHSEERLTCLVWLFTLWTQRGVLREPWKPCSQCGDLHGLVPGRAPHTLPAPPFPAPTTGGACLCQFFSYLGKRFCQTRPRR